jgi:hypothetical protein
VRTTSESALHRRVLPANAVSMPRSSTTPASTWGAGSFSASGRPGNRGVAEASVFFVFSLKISFFRFFVRSFHKNRTDFFPALRAISQSDPTI